MKKILVAIGLMASTITGVAAAWPYVEPFMAATRGYVRQIADVHEIKIDIANGKREAVENDIFKAQLEMKKTQDATTQEFIHQQIIKLEATKTALERQIETLHKATQ